MYAMGSGISIFEYDKFGGCGYIVPDNILEEDKTNFSDRGTKNKYKTENLIKNIINGYSNACDNADNLRKCALARDSIDKIITNQLQAINSRPLKKTKLNMDAKLFCNAAVAAMIYIIRLNQTSQTHD